MLRLYLKLIAPITLACLALSLVTRALGSTQPPHPALRGFVEGCEDKPQPCWYGIVPGVTTEEEAINIVASLGYQKNIGKLEPHIRYEYVNTNRVPSCVQIWRYEGAETMHALTLGCLRIKMGDIIDYWGTPKVLGYDDHRSIDSLGYLGYSARAYRAEFQPDIWMYEIYLYIPPPTLINEDNETLFGVYHWHGFAPRWRYCQLESNIWACGKRILLPPVSITPVNSNLPTLPAPPVLPILPTLPPA